MLTPDRIVLTADADQKAKLQRKLAEYETRVAFTPPEADPHSHYKLCVLKELLEKGFVNVGEFRNLLAEQFGWSFERSYYDAVSIIAGYNANDLSHISGGTGLA